MQAQEQSHVKPQQPQQQTILAPAPFVLYEQSELTGTIDRAIFHNAQNGFSILAVKLSDQKDEFGDPIEFTAKGSMPSVRVGDEYKFKGEWKVDRKRPQYGKQFSFDSFEMLMPTTRQGIISYIASVAHGVGHIKAASLVRELSAKYPEKAEEKGGILELIRENPAVLQECKTINNAQAEEIATHLAQNEVLAELTSLICREGVTPGLATRIYAQYGPDAVDTVKENPYLLAGEMYGIGIKRADVIAMAVGIAKDSEYRIKAGIAYILKEAQNSGHCYLEPKHIVYGLREGKQMVVTGLVDLLGLDAGEINIGVVKAANEKLIEESRCVRQGDAVYDFKLSWRLLRKHLWR